jgi:hypothetical protein
MLNGSRPFTVQRRNFEISWKQPTVTSKVDVLISKPVAPTKKYFFFQKLTNGFWPSKQSLPACSTVLNYRTIRYQSPGLPLITLLKGNWQYDLRAVLVHDGLFGRRQLYSYVKDKGVWWKSVDSDVTEVYHVLFSLSVEFALILYLFGRYPKKSSSLIQLEYIWEQGRICCSTAEHCRKKRRLCRSRGHSPSR